jgi:hypothetical protein
MMNVNSYLFYCRALIFCQFYLEKNYIFVAFHGAVLQNSVVEGLSAVNVVILLLECETYDMCMYIMCDSDKAKRERYRKLHNFYVLWSIINMIRM